MVIFTARGHAKINLYLRIVERLPDGYHRLESMMQSLSLYDEVELMEKDAGISVSYVWVDPVQQGASFAATIGEVLNPALPCDRRNLAWRAAELIQSHCRIERGVEIRLRKAIPMAAGLAGGSADTAAVLLALNRMWDLGLDPDGLMTLGARLGADVPFCLVGGSKFCTGIGDVVSEAPPVPGWPVLLVKPSFSISTPEVYRRWDEGCLGKSDRVRVSWEEMQEALKYKDVALVGRRLYNELELVSESLQPQIAQWKALIADTGPRGILMTGSGPTLFALYEAETEALAAAETLVNSAKAPGPAQIMVTKTWTHGCEQAVCGGSL